MKIKGQQHEELKTHLFNFVMHYKKDSLNKLCIQTSTYNLEKRLL